MKKLALALLVVAQPASTDTCDDRFMFASNIMRQYQAGENAHVMLVEAGNNETAHQQRKGEDVAIRT